MTAPENVAANDPKPAPARTGWTLTPANPPPSVSRGPRCKRHQDAAATARCERCCMNWCPFCAKQIEANGAKFLACACGGRCTPIESAEELAAHRTFEQDLADVFAYPVRSEGRGLLIVGALFVLTVDLIWGGAVRNAARAAPLLRTGNLGGYAAAGAIYSGVWASVVLALVAGYLVSHLMRVVHSTAKGEDVPPGFPEFTSVAESMLLPFYRAVAALSMAFGPGLLLLALPGAARLLGLPVLVLGGVYLPMAVTAVAISESLDGLNPILVFRSIRRIPFHYCFGGSIFTAGLGLLVFGAPFLDYVPILGFPLRAVLVLYLLVFSGRVLGLLYRHHQKELGWY